MSFGLGTFLKKWDLEKPEQREAAAIPPVQYNDESTMQPFDLENFEQCEAPALPVQYYNAESATLSNGSSMQTPGPENPNIHHYESADQVPKEIRKYVYSLSWNLL